VQVYHDNVLWVQLTVESDKPLIVCCVYVRPGDDAELTAIMQNIMDNVVFLRGKLKNPQEETLM
jgi:hypothetical protein